MSSITTSLAGECLGRYQVERCLGRGSTAEVWAAQDQRLRRRVAIKILGPEVADDPEAVRRFQREARLVAALDHPHILSVYDVGELDGRPWVVLPYLGGGTLRERLERGPQPLPRVAEIVRQLAAGLDAAHRIGVLHRDVKPANVLIGRDGRLILTDFGIARLLDGDFEEARRSDQGLVLGTPAYLAPEVVEGKPASAASDQYSLACVAWEMLTGKPPFQGSTVRAVLHQHVSRSVPSAREWIAGLPVAIDRVFARAMDKDPRARFPRCGELAEAILDLVPAEQRIASQHGGTLGLERPQTPPPLALDSSPSWPRPSSGSTSGSMDPDISSSGLRGAAAIQRQRPRPVLRWAAWMVAVAVLVLLGLGWASLAGWIDLGPFGDRMNDLARRAWTAR